MPTNYKNKDVNESPITPAGLQKEWSSYLFIGLAALCITAAELLLKRGAMATANDPAPMGVFGVSVLDSGWTWLGIVAYIASFLCYLHVLRRIPVHLAFGLMSVVQVLVPLGAWWFLAENVSPRRWGGILIVLTGIVVITRPAIKVEEHL